MSKELEMLERLFDAKLDPIHGMISDIKQNQEARMKRIEDAHKRIDAWENRFWGVIASVPVVGTGIVAIIAYLGKKVSAVLV